MQKFSNGNLIHHSHSRVVQNKKKSQGIVREGESSAARVVLVIFKDVKLLTKDNEELPFDQTDSSLLIYVQEIFDALLIVNYVSTENSHQTDINPRYGKFRDKHFLYKVRQSSSSKE